MRDAAVGLERALGTARDELQAQWETLVGVMAEVAEKAREIAAAEQEKATLRMQVEALNVRVGLMADVAAAVEAERDAAGTELAVARKDVKDEVRWKWRFFWWGAGMTVLAGAYVLARVYRVLP